MQCSVKCTEYNALLCTEQCKLYCGEYTVHSAKYTVYSAQCTLYTVHHVVPEAGPGLVNRVYCPNDEREPV